MKKNQQFSNVLVNKIYNFNYLTEFKTLNLFEYHSSVNLIILKANLDYIQPLLENFEMKQKLLSLSLSDNLKIFKMATIFRTIYNRLFKFKPELERKFENFKRKAKPNEQTKLFCAQVRIGGQSSCVYDDRIFASRNSSKLFWNFKRNKIIKNELNYKLFITSDTESVANEAIEEFGEDRVRIIEGLYKHLDRSPNNSTSCKLYEKTILDMHAFQLCDKAVISRGGYGLMGNFLREDPFEEFYRYTEIIKEESSIKSVEVKFIKIENFNDLEENWKSRRINISS